MLESSRYKAKKALYIFSVLCILAFIIFGFRGVLFPPVVTIETISDGMTVPSGVVSITGTTKRVEELFIQGKQVTRSLAGDFSTEVAVFHPYTIIQVEARDRFNKTIKKEIRLSVEK